MRLSRIMLVALCGACAPSWVSADTYCNSLTGLSGKYVVVHPREDGEQHRTHGYVVSVKPEMLVVELEGHRTYVNCTEIYSVVVADKTAEGKKAPAPLAPIDDEKAQ